MSTTCGGEEGSESFKFTLVIGLQCLNRKTKLFFIRL